MDEAAICDILTSTGIHAELADRYGVSASTIGKIRRGEMHETVAPELPRWQRGGLRGIKRLCSNCLHWDQDRCDLGFPDPKEEGHGFARDCSVYTVRVAA